MVKPRRLFLFAGFDATGVIDGAEIMHVAALARLGDVVYVADSDIARREIAKIKKIPNVLYAVGARHGEYDFGSYKRGYLYARDNGILDNYDILYMVNNSVYGPLGDMRGLVRRIEGLNTAAFAPTLHIKGPRRNLESWFIGMRRGVFMAPWFGEFLSSVAPQADKVDVIRKYELGFSRLLCEHNMTFDGAVTCRGRAVYNRVRWLYKSGVPFMKRVAFIRHNGALGRQVDYILRHTTPMARTAILDSARRTYGADVVKRNLTRNPIKVLWRNAVYIARKTGGGKK